ncbi:glycosyltransferase family 4 protein [Halomicrococcus gelatinilyticus]|uniref:glycosyltransferase family 4 protein n=1 Tax=Halomicrococcus gelatinilyticus TaxID=1702103 RepID=UPI002E130441
MDAAIGGQSEQDEDSSADAGITVVMYPDYREANPYQRALRDSLDERGIDVQFASRHRYVPLLGSVVECGNPDVLHVHWLSSFTVTDSSLISALLGVRTVFELLLLRLFGIDVVWTVHNRFDHEKKSPRVELVTRHLVARLVDRMTVHCDAARAVLLEAYRLPDRFRDRITVIPHGHFRDVYSNEASRETARQRFGLGDETVFLYFGRIRRYKNVPELLSTFSQLDGEAKLLVVGKPWDETVAETVRDPDDPRIETRFEFVEEDEIQWYMNAVDAVVLPYEAVLTSGAAILAMSFGRPVIGPDIGCLGELLNYGGISYDPDAPNGLDRALRTALVSDLSERGDRCADFVERLTWDGPARRLRRLYD